MLNALIGALVGAIVGALIASNSSLATLWQALVAKLKGWKTMIWGGALAASAPVIETLDTLKVVDWSQFLTPRNVAIAGAAIGIVTLWLRWVTTASVGEKH